MRTLLIGAASLLGIGCDQSPLPPAPGIPAIAPGQGTPEATVAKPKVSPTEWAVQSID